MEAWMPIKRASLEVEGSDPEYRGLMRVVVGLSDYPPEEWQNVFGHPPEISISLSMHAPELCGDQVVLRAPDTQVKEYVEHLDARIAATNKFYEQQVLPRVRREEERRLSAEAQEERRLKEARDRLRDL